ncbi:MAG: hypothetical protein V4472_27630 [Pseudomonadota bacterium]
MSILLPVAVLASLAGQASPPADPLAPAASGMLQCYAPDVVRHRCQSLAGYRKRADGMFDNSAVVMLSPSPYVVMETVTPVEIDAGAVCGAIRKQDIEAAIVSVDGKKLVEPYATNLRARIAAGMKPIIDHRICTTYVPDGERFIARAVIEGSTQTTTEQTVIWVSPDAGYTVAP